MSYATIADLYIYGAPQKAFGQLTTDQLTGGLESASNILDTYFRGRYSLPLVVWDVSVKEATCRIAAYNLLSVRGYNPASGSDVNIKDRYDEAIAWAVRVEKQQAHPNVTPQQHETPDYNQPMVVSTSVVNVGTGAISKNRGW